MGKVCLATGARFIVFALSRIIKMSCIPVVLKRGSIQEALRPVRAIKSRAALAVLNFQFFMGMIKISIRIIIDLPELRSDVFTSFHKSIAGLKDYEPNAAHDYYRQPMLFHFTKNTQCTSTQGMRKFLLTLLMMTTAPAQQESLMNL
ncbi:MAG: hypothetical protein ICV65_06575 [Flavisolibacter sp.]|nr:hypothetical protein [Flavisolibacter sp.]